MYLAYWGLKVPPFENVPNQDLFYKSPQHEEALIRMVYAVEHKKGLAVLTGEVGAGKTTISRVLYDYLDTDGFEVITLVNPALNEIDFLKAILMEIGEQTDDSSKTLLLKQLNERLTRNVDHDINTILIIDEAHMIKDTRLLEELRMLLNLQHKNQFLITLILMGQPPLASNLELMKPLNERVSIRYDLKPLDINDTTRYIMFRLKEAGASRGLFTREAIPPLYKWAKGIPLRINNVCDRCMLLGMMRKAKRISSSLVKEAIEDLK